MNETFGIAGDGECPPRAIWLTTQNVDRFEGQASSSERSFHIDLVTSTMVVVEENVVYRIT